MTKEEAIEKLKAEQGNNELEGAHIKADEVLCELLKSLGMSDVVEEYEKIEKYFA